MKGLVLWGILTICFAGTVCAQEAAVDSVIVTFEVVVPESTPEDAIIFWAGSLNKWDPGDIGSGFGAKEYAQPATYSNGIWSVRLTAEKDSEHFYKYTRGSIYSSEEQADYTFRPVRSVVFDTDKAVRDTVEAWHDRPPESLSDSWPTISLDTTEINISYDGITLEGTGTILYDKTTGSQFYDFTESNTTVNKIPDNFYDPVYYYQGISATTNDLQLIVAAQTQPEGPWHLYVDKNGNQSIDKSEQVMTLEDDSKKQEWSDEVPVRNIIDGEPLVESTRLTIRKATDLPAGHRSTARKAPDLTIELPYKHREGMINGHTFYVTAPFQVLFTNFQQLTIDHNQNDTLEIGSGCNEVYSNDISVMSENEIFPSFKLGGRFWQVADIDPHGRWIRLRPGQSKEEQSAIVKGEPAPDWQAVTFKGDTLSSEKLQGKYVLLDFWGSWCGPCIQEIPELKKAYYQFRDQNFEIIGFAYESRGSLERALKEYRLPWPQVLDDTADYSSLYLVRGYPSHFLIGPDGTVLEMDQSLNGDQLIPTLEKYLE